VTKDQLVPGGKGILGKLNKGLEPTGLTPWGPKPNIKLAITTINEKKGQADLAIYFRICIKTMFVDLGCTPYFIGPIPVGSVKEKGTVVIATTAPPPPIDPPGPPPGIDPPPQGCKGKDCQPRPCPDGKPNCPFHHPLDGGVFTSGYGWRNGRFHAGVDISTRSDTRPGSTVRSAEKGTVVATPDFFYGCRNYGHRIEISHPGRGVYTTYNHLYSRNVASGQGVGRGQAIAVEGNTSCGMITHLHYEIQLGPGLRNNTMDPLRFPHEPPIR
jgi:hypothetical protein